ncbi:hypothetical protein [Phenylobacterium soli]|uniref:Uncharacterized protein n=1 Tax=Phenylobacterium soli TaxID=2170551 RepID=A0A328AGP7_9CAUL|nr:hypothetical protein [Phenylobacterium soli]RAK53932.1 hypothetical protein DJ017_05045 [Phenylobacterium soli]
MKKLILAALAAAAIAGPAHAAPTCQGEACGDIASIGDGDSVRLSNHGKRPVLIIYNDGWDDIWMTLQPGETKATGEAVLSMFAHYVATGAKKRAAGPNPPQSR